MERMGRKCGALGFAVYLNHLEHMKREARKYDVDIVFLYTLEDDLREMYRAIRELTAEGNTVLVEKKVPESIRCRKMMRLSGGEVITVASDD